MKKITSILLALLVIILCSTNAEAQLFSIGIGGGLTQVMGPDEWTNEVSNNGLGYSSEYNFGVMAKLGLPLIPIKPRGFILYHQLSGEGTTPTLQKTYAEGDLKYAQSVLTIGLGAQYQFIPLPVGFDPYLSFDLLYNNFGKLEQNDVELPNTDKSRYGVGVGIGTAITIIPILNFDLMLSYQWLNLVGKEDVQGVSEPTISVITLDAFIMLSFL